MGQEPSGTSTMDRHSESRIIQRSTGRDGEGSRRNQVYGGGDREGTVGGDGVEIKEYPTKE